MSQINVLGDANHKLENPTRDITPRVTVAMLGARRHYAVPRLLYEAGLLERFYTDSYVGNKPWLETALKSIPAQVRPSGVQRWLGRCDPVLPPEKVGSFECFGLWYAWALSRAQAGSQREGICVNAAKYFNRCILKGGFADSNIVWGFNGAALELFQAAKEQKILCVLEQTILPKRLEIQLLHEEVERWPDWEPGLEIPEINSSMSMREEQEWAMADCIVAGSEFVRNGLVKCGVPEVKIHVVPYGVDSSRFQQKTVGVPVAGSQPLRILFAGHVGLRKGVPDLLQALQQIKFGKVEVRVAGSIALNSEKLKQAGNQVQFLGRVPRSEMQQLFHWADVFVLPSIVEGSAAVTYESLMSGVPVITTSNAGSIVQDGINGFVVPIRNPDALADAITRYNEERALLVRHQAATEESHEYAGLDRYRADLERLICKLAGAHAQDG